VVTIPQIRAGRALVDWSQQDLANRAGVGVATMKRIEAGTVPLSTEYQGKIIAAFKTEGVEFLSDNAGLYGVLHRSSNK
jgi:predicted transcriptional regulator